MMTFRNTLGPSRLWLAMLALWTLSCWIAPSVALAQGYQSDYPVDPYFQATPCGGAGQRACCAASGEADASGNIVFCSAGMAMVAGCTPSLEPFEDCTCLLSDGSLMGSPGTCRAVTPCGGPGQRACCVVGPEAGRSRCDSGSVEVTGCTENCQCEGGGSSTSSCLEVTPCGGAGERACCVSEGEACRDGLVKVEGLQPSPESACAVAGFVEFSKHICAPVSPCGGAGQRVCCEGAACEAGLEAWPGCTGDCTCVGGKASFSCSDPDTILLEPETGFISLEPDAEQCAMRGYADLHVHLFAHMAHGGEIFAGRPYDWDGGIAAALSPDDDLEIHGFHGLLGGDILGGGTGDLDSTLAEFNWESNIVGGLSPYGAPLFNGWPTWHSTTHQQVYYKWLERAWKGGLRLISALAVTNEALCKSKTPDANQASCEDSMASIDQQLDMTWDMQRFIDAQPGGGWFRIVTTPQQAREVIAAGKLAVVLGIEVDNLFNCRESGCRGKQTLVTQTPCPEPENENANDPCETDKQYVTRKVDEYYAKGVRHIFPIHNFDNGFGAPATWQDAINLGNKVVTGDWWAAEECPAVDGDAEAYGFKLLSSFPALLTTLAGQAMFDLPIELVKDYRGYSTTCHREGLKPLGEHLLEELVKKGMVIDVDHMSNHALDATLNFLGAQDPVYPVVASHVQFQELNQNLEDPDNDPSKESHVHERMRTRAQLERIRDLGGMVAAMTKDDLADTDSRGVKGTVPYPDGDVPDSCRHSSMTFAQAYQYAVDVMGGPVAFGSDFNGVAAHVGPRFGHEACGGNIEERSEQLRAQNRLEYPFTIEGFGRFEQQKTGERTFDFNNDGLAHVGLLPDLIADMQKVGLPANDVDRLFESAEAFVQLWERAEARNGLPPGTCSAVDVTVDAGADCKAEAQVLDPVLVDDVYNGDLSWTQSPAGPYDLGTTEVDLTVMQTGSCMTDSCTATITVEDNTAPVLSCPSVTTECTSYLSGRVEEPPTPELVADNCDDAELFGCDPPAAGDFPLGVTPFSCTASDDSGNQTTCNYAVKVVDTIVPTIDCPDNITAECAGVETIVDVGEAEASDSCSDVTLANDSPGGFPLGDTLVLHSATDSSQNVSTCPQLVSVDDTIPPTISTVVASPNTLWPPNHKMVDIAVTVAATDVCDPTAPVCTLTSIDVNESDNALGDGATTGDALITGPLSARLRAERSGGGSGRVYTLHVRCADETGNGSTATTEVRVSRDQRP